MSRPFCRRSFWWCVGALVSVPALLVAVAAAEPVDDPPLPDPAGPRTFTRVHVPAGRLAEVGMGGERYVPMPLTEFERAVESLAGVRPDAAAAAGGPLRPVASGARVVGRFDTAGRLTGQMSFVVPEDAVHLPAQVTVGHLLVRRASRETAAGTGPTVVHALRSGLTALVLAGPGTYRCEFALATPGGAGRARWGMPFQRLPLVPAVRTEVELDVPSGQRPCGGGVEWSLVVPGPLGTAAAEPATTPAVRTWRAVIGPQDELVFGLLPDDPQPRDARVWAACRIGLEETRVTTVIQPTGRWTEPRLALVVDPALTLLSARVADGPVRHRDLAWRRTTGGVEVILPAALLGSTAPVEVVGIAPAAVPQTVGLPRVTVAADAWSGGGTSLRLDAALALVGLVTEDAVVVSPGVAAAWPLPRVDDDGDGVAAVYLAAQGPAAGCRVALEPRGPLLDMARVTTVDVAAARLSGVATCDVRVERGEAFALSGRVGSGWIIDAVEWVEPVDQSAGSATISAGETTGLVEEGLDWRVTADGSGSLLRIGLAAAATRQRPLGLRITGHRAGVDVGVAFPIRELEMVALDGEADGQTALALRAAPDTTLEIDPAPAALPPVAARLQRLAGQETVRSWLPAGVGLPAAEARLVQRRPPIAVHAHIGLSVRDDRVAESFTLECRPGESPLDAAVVHFSEPIEDTLEWSLLPPAGGSVVARPLEMAGRRGGETSWLVEFVPPVREPVSIRATRSVSLDGATAVPLVRVDGAVDLVGDIVVRTSGRRRPAVVNRRLTELPPGPAAPGSTDDVIAEFGFDAAAAESASIDGAALEIVPDGGGSDRDARAWVWSEAVDCWCHRSGRTEVESHFDIENHGRSSLALMLPPGKRLLGILLDGRRVVLDAETVGGEVTIDLPGDRRRVALTVRTVADDTTVGTWTVDSAGGAIDLPVLERSWRVWLPPGVEIAVGPAHHREVAPAAVTWSERLVGVPLNHSSAPMDDDATVDRLGGLMAGCRERVFVPLPGRPAADRVRLVGRNDIDRAALLLATFLAGCLLLAAVWRPGFMVVVPLAAGLIALWVPAPWHVPARAVWWATLTVALSRLLAGRHRGLGIVGVALASFAGGPACGEEQAEVPRVFITPVGGTPTALVPQRLFDRLGAVADENAPRVVAAHVELPGPGGGAGWHVTLDIDADAGTSLSLPFPGQAAAPAAGVLLDGRPATMLPAGPGSARLPIVESGRHRVEWVAEPIRIRRGEIVVAMIALPPAPQAVLTSGPGGLPVEPVVEAGRPGTAFVPVLPESAWSAGEPPQFDISGADRIAVLAALKPGVRLATVPRSARSRNEIEWGPTSCRVTARFEIDAGEAVLPAVVVRADPRLVPVVPDDADAEIDRIGPGRFRIVRREPEAGIVRLDIAWTMPLDEPTGVFTVPEVWLETPLADDRSVRLMAAPGLRAGVLPQAGLGNGGRTTAPGGELSWRVDTTTADAAAPAEPLPARVPVAGSTRVIVTRGPAVVRASQQVRLALGPRRVDLALQARIEAESAVVTIPLSLPADVQLGKVILTDETSTDGPRRPLDVRIVRAAVVPGGPPSPVRLTVVLQQPQAGRLRLDAEAVVPGPPPAEGVLPVMRLALDGASAAVISWAAADGMAAEVGGSEAAAAGVVELTAESPAPDYRLVGVPFVPLEPVPEPVAQAGAQAGATAEADAESAPAGPRLELVDTHLAIDARGRGWGTARLDLVVSDPVVRVSLPPGMRPFKVFVDGRAVTDPRPAGTAAAPLWEVRLLDVRWPRSLEVVFAGDVGTAVEGGRLTRLEAPGIDGLTAVASLWTIAVPRGVSVRVAPPATVVDPAAAQLQRTAALDRLGNDFARAIAAAAPGEAARLGDMLAARRRPPSLPANDPTGQAAIGTTDVFETGATVIAPPDGQRVEFRLARGPDRSVTGRALASLALLLVAAIASAVRRVRARAKAR